MNAPRSEEPRSSRSQGPLDEGAAEQASEDCAADPDEQQVEQAAAEAARIGGGAANDRGDPAARPVREAGGGEAEGFEESEELLIEHASHGDSQAAHAILHDRGAREEQDAREDGEADHERTSEGDPYR
jgi:hypothetical protein